MLTPPGITRRHPQRLFPNSIPPGKRGIPWGQAVHENPGSGDKSAGSVKSGLLDQGRA